MICRK